MSKFRTQFDRISVVHPVGGESLCITSAAEEHDLNKIVMRLSKGLDPGVPIRSLRYGHSVTPEEAENSKMVIAQARSEFESLSVEEKGDTKSFGEYLAQKQIALTQEGGTVQSLDVTVPTDRKPVSSKKRGVDETQTDDESSGSEDLQKGSKGSSKK